MQPDAVYFPSKVDWWLTLLAWGPFVLIPVLLVASPPPPDQLVPGVVVLAVTVVPVIVLMAWMWRTTGYTITRDQLIVKSGPFRRTVPLSAIHTVRRSRNPLASFALSMDRLEIRYGKRGLVLVSPREQEAFLDLLRQRCPQSLEVG